MPVTHTFDHRTWPLAILLLVAAALLPAATRHVGPAAVGSRPGEMAEAAIGALPLSFVPNAGQEPKVVRFAAHGADTSLYFTTRGVTIAQVASHDRAAGGPGRWAVRLAFPGGAAVDPVPRGRTGAVTSFFRGPSSEWRTGLPSFSSLVYPDLWPGIDLAFSGAADRLKYEFRVAPGADPSRIAMAYRGARGVELTPAGTLRVATPAGGFTDDVPLAWQEGDEGRLPVEARYVAGAGRDVYRFRLGAHDPALPLVVDPAILLSAGYIGGSGIDQGRGVALDSDGNIYVAGTTTSAQDSFPVTEGSYDTTYNGVPTAQGPDPDAFVAKLDPSGSSLLYASYIGGEKPDLAFGIDVDADGNAYMTGTTKSHVKFPLLNAGATLSSFKGAFEGFVTKVSSSGTDLIYSGVIGGSRYDSAHDIEVDELGNAYVVGMTKSSEGQGFPVSIGPDLTFNGGGDPPHPPYDAWVGRVKADGTGLDYLGYIGGAESDGAMALGIDEAGAAYVGGYTESTEDTFPEVVGPDLTHNGGVLDVFVAKVAPGGGALEYAGYIGGAGEDAGFSVGDGIGLAVDPAGSAYLTGQTQSKEGTFPDGDGFGTLGGPDLTFNGAVDAFVAKVQPDGAALAYAGYIGGRDSDSGVGIAVDTTGNAYVTGETGSSEATFPDFEGPDPTFNGGSGTNPKDAFVARVAASGQQLDFAGYIGGAADDVGRNIAADDLGNVYVTGVTGSTEQQSFPVSGGPDLIHNGGDDAFLARITYEQTVPPPPPPPAGLSISMTDAPDPVEVGSEVRYEATVTNTGAGDATGVTLTDQLPPEVIFQEATTTQGICTVPPGTAPGGTASCTLGTIPAGQSALVTIVVIPVVAAQITNQAETASPDDTDTSDNVAVATTDVQGKSCTVIGTKLSDRLTGTTGDDVICGLRSGDLLKGIEGNDVVYGGTGNDVIEGGDGDDFLSGSEGPDRLTGGAGADGHAGGPGADTLDTRDGIGGNDLGDGGPDTDTCRFDSGDVLIDCP